MALNFSTIAGMTFPQLYADPEFRAHYIKLYETVHKKDGKVFQEREYGFIWRIISGDTRLSECSTLSIANAMLSQAYYGLSLEPVGKAAAYLQSRKGVLSFYISAYGELALRIRAGQIRYADPVVPVFEGDDFDLINGIVHHSARQASDKIVGAWIKITRADGSVFYKHFQMFEIQNWRKKAPEAQQKSEPWTGGPGGQITRGHLEAKVLRHSMETFPRLVTAAPAVFSDESFDDAEAAYASAIAELQSSQNTTADQPEGATAPSLSPPPPAPVIAAPDPAQAGQNGSAPGATPARPGAATVQSPTGVYDDAPVSIPVFNF